MKNILKNIAISVAFLMVVSCAGKRTFNTCVVTDAEITKSGLSGMVLRFTDNGKCDYKLVKEDSDWLIALPSGKFEKFNADMDTFSAERVKIYFVGDSEIRFVFNGNTNVTTKKEGLRTAFIIRGESYNTVSAASVITDVVCPDSNSPFLLKVLMDGVSAYEFGLIKGDVGYLDIFSVRLVPDFNLSDSCGNFVKISEVSFPERVRLLISDPLISTMNAASSSKEIVVSDKNFSSSRYLLKIQETIHGKTQTIKVLTSSRTEAKVESISENEVVISLGMGIKPVFDVKENTKFNGYFSTVAFKKNFEDTVLVLKTDTPEQDVNVYIENTDYGFVIYTKTIR